MIDHLDAAILGRGVSRGCVCALAEDRYVAMRRNDVVRRWTLAWVGGSALGVLNGGVREGTYGKLASERVAHQLSVVTGVGAFGAYFWELQRRWPIADARDARRIGSRWLVMTIAFEFGFGRLAARKSWRELLADYNLVRGRLWLVLLVWLGVGPSVVRRLNPA